LFYERLNCYLPGIRLVDTQRTVVDLLKRKYGLFYFLRLHHFWYVLAVVIIVVGLLISWDAFQMRQPSPMQRIAAAAEKLVAHFGHP
jgi:ABC-type iron transport system FetAB permease component